MTASADDGVPLRDLLWANLVLLLLLGSILAVGLVQVDVVGTEYVVVGTGIWSKDDGLEFTIDIEEAHGNGTGPDGSVSAVADVIFTDSLGESGWARILQMSFPLDSLDHTFDGEIHHYHVLIPQPTSKVACWPEQNLQYTFSYQVCWDDEIFEDEVGLHVSVPEAIKALNGGPEASITLSLGDRHLEYFVNATDPEGGWLRYIVDFGDGDTSTFLRGTHDFSAYGEYTVNVTVTDGKVNGTVYLERTVIFSPPESFVILDSHRGDGELVLTVEMTNIGPKDLLLHTWAFALLDSDENVHEFATVEVNGTLLSPKETVELSIHFAIPAEIEPTMLLYDYRLEIPLNGGS